MSLDNKKYQAEANDNPLLETGGLPRFDCIEPRHVEPAIRQVLATALRQLEEIEQNPIPTWSGIMRPLQELDRPFEYAWGPVTHLFGVKNSPELRESYEKVLPDIVQFGLRVRQSRPIHAAIKAIRNGDDWNNLDTTRRRIIDQNLLSARLSGIDLEGESKRRFNAIEEELSQLSTEFANHVLDATKAFELILTDGRDVEGMPDSLLRLAAQSYNDSVAATDASQSDSATAESGPWRFTLEAPSYVPFLKHCRQRALREQMYRAYRTRASDGELDNTPLINRILELRQEKARLLGYRTFAEVSLARKMAASAEAVDEMLERLRTAAWEPAHADVEAYRQHAAASGVTEPLEHWDLAFWAERLREKQFDYTDEQLRPYFPVDRVLDGLFRLVHRLFAITVTPADGEAPIWHTDVRFFKVCDEHNAPIAAFYFDPYSRPENKRGGAWMNTCLSRRWIDERLQQPVAHLVCNATPPIGKTPSLMTFPEVQTLFHEFGHGLQHMLTTVDEPDAAGINGIEWDAVELPSQFMENWCYHKPTMCEISGHYQTGEPLPDDLFNKLCAARTFAAGSLMLRQLLFALTDLSLHHSYDPKSDTETVFDVMQRISERTSVLPVPSDDRFLCAFQHIFAGGYAAGYYSYKWAEVLSADAFSAFEEAGLDDAAALAETGRQFRDTILAFGGSRHPMEVFETFRGREPDPTALLRQHGLVKDRVKR